MVTHPVRGDALVFEAPLPKSWPRGFQKKDEGRGMKDD